MIDRSLRVVKDALLVPLARPLVGRIGPRWITAVSHVEPERSPSIGDRFHVEGALAHSNWPAVWHEETMNSVSEAGFGPFFDEHYAPVVNLHDTVLIGRTSRRDTFSRLNAWRRSRRGATLGDCL